jgi:hypothetical protein
VVGLAVPVSQKVVFARVDARRAAQNSLRIKQRETQKHGFGTEGEHETIGKKIWWQKNGRPIFAYN